MGAQGTKSLMRFEPLKTERFVMFLVRREASPSTIKVNSTSCIGTFSIIGIKFVRTHATSETNLKRACKIMTSVTPTSEETTTATSIRGNRPARTRPL
ncbi:hypothetical protein ElyMa_003420600 [Elysia marginata]|uniref:Uncharacterized protein n=1 Tax=Elysia marginata TaxID=1093978 RepID=A0AAV4JQQ6_9GAST|nr:hypothetical protein ElyMa_003420600 [Elysia marginata]